MLGSKIQMWKLYNGKLIATLDDCAAFQQNLASWRNGSTAPSCCSTRENTKSCTLGNNTLHQYLLEVTKVESSLSEKDLMVLLDNKFAISQQCTPVATKACSIWGCIRKSITSKSRDTLLPLLSALAETSFVQSPLLCGPGTHGLLSEKTIVSF